MISKHYEFFKFIVFYSNFLKYNFETLRAAENSLVQIVKGVAAKK